MRVRRMFAAALLASALAQAEPLSPRVAERYKQMLAANSAEGIALDRLWKGALDGGTTEELLAGYRNAQSAPGRMILGLLLRKAGRDDEARAAFESAAKADPASPLPPLAMGRMELEHARPREAAVSFEKALGILPKDDARVQDALMQLGAAWGAAGEPGKAADVWERMVALAPDDLELRRRLAQACADAGQTELAIRHLAFLAEHAQPAERAKALQQMAGLHSAAGRPDDAMQALERAVRGTAPGNWLRGELLGQVIRLAQRMHAEDALEKKWLAQVEANPRDLGGYLQLVEFYDRVGNPEQERAWLEKVTALVPGNAEHALRLARLLAQMDQLDAAAAVFDKLLAVQPKNTDLVFERARLDLRREDGEVARQRIAAVLSAHRDDELLRARALRFFQEHRMLDSVEEHLQADAVKGAEDAVIALAEFYFSQKRNEEARMALGRLFRAGDPPAEEARRRSLAAEHLKGHGELTAGVSEMEAAVRLTPDSRESLLLLGELRALLAQPAEAKAAYERAYKVSRSDAERLEVDGKLFESIRSAAVSAGEGRPQGQSAAALVEGHIRDLMREANDAKSPAGWLRVARWKAWNGDKSSAVTFAAKAADMEPRNPAAREFLARHSASNGEAAYAVAYFRELIELNPAGRDGYLREIAQLELQRGNHAEALGIFAQLVKSNPGSMDALADLGLAQERAGKFTEAVATWRQVLAVAAAPRRREAASSLLRGLERTGAHDEATELLLRGADEAPDERTRFARIDELLMYCQRHARLPWVRGIFEKRRKAKADDHVSGIALGRTLKLMGEKTAAFEMFADAALSTPNDAEVLPELVREAEELHRLGLAVRLQEQFVRTARVERPDAWVRLATLQEGSGDLENAERTWAQAVAKFPRDADVLRRAADFHVQWGERGTAAVLLGKLCALEVTDLRSAYELGELQFAAGRFAEARVAFEGVMKLTQAATQIVYPSERGGGPWSDRSAPVDSGVRRSFSGGRVTTSAGSMRRLDKSEGRLEGEAQFHLGALRRLAEIARRMGGATLEKWIADWTPAESGETTETLWALYFAGARDAVLSLAEKNSAAGTDRLVHRQAFVWMAFESGLFARLGAWLNAEGRTGEDMELFSQAFTEALRSRPELMSPAMMQGLFPDGARARLWPCAVELAGRKHTREAILLGHRVFENAPLQRAVVGRELARWHLALGTQDGVDEARTVLAAACEGPGDSLESPVYGAMRDLYFLLPPGQRTAFVRERLRKADEGTVHGLNTRALLFALDGRSDEARGALSRLLERRPIGAVQEEGNSALREWVFANGTVSQLMEWSLPELARHVLDVTLADEGLRGLQALQQVRHGAPTIESVGEPWGERPLFHEAILRGLAQRDAFAYLGGGRLERETMLAKLRGQSQEVAWSRFADALESVTGGRPHAVAVWRMGWELDPQNPAALRKLADASRLTGDVATAEAVRRRCVEEHINPGNDTTPREFALELAELLEARGAVEDALAVIQKAVERNPEEMRLLMREAQLLERAGRADEAAAVWKRMIFIDGGTAYSRIALADVLEQRGKYQEAIEVRTRAGASGDTALPSLLCKNGQTDEALLALDRLTGNGAVQAAMAVAEVLALKGEGALARGVLVAAAAKTAEARALLQLRAKLLTIPGSPPTRAFLTRMRDRMRDSVRQHPELAGGYFDFFERYAARFGIGEEFAAEVAAAWADGKGDAAAGMVMLRSACGRSEDEAARGMCMALMNRADVSDATMDALSALAARTGRRDLQLLVAERRASRAWPMADGMLDLVRTLAVNGSRERAAEVLSQHAWLAGFTGGAEALGRAWLALGDAEQARGFLSRAMKENAPAPPPSVLAAMAQVHVATNNFPAAKLLLRRAFAEPVCHEYAALAAYLDASGGMARWTEVADEFQLSARARHELQLAIFAVHEKHGRLREALALVAAEPSVVSPVGVFRAESGAEPLIDGERLRRIAAKTGGFEEVAQSLRRMAASHMPDAAAELEALHADWAERRGERDSAVGHLERAAELRPVSWEFARRVAEIRLAGEEWPKARAVLERFYWGSPSPAEREAALELWEKAGDPAKTRKPGS
jgi:tetratricopeptide (TPR) repeat protein